LRKIQNLKTRTIKHGAASVGNVKWFYIYISFETVFFVVGDLKRELSYSLLKDVVGLVVKFFPTHCQGSKRIMGGRIVAEMIRKKCK